MRATIMDGAGDVRVENVPDALVVVTRAATCGSDLWRYKCQIMKGVDPLWQARLS